MLTLFFKHGAELLFQLLREFGIILKEDARIVASLTHAHFTVVIPGTALVDEFFINRKIEDGALFGNAFAIEHIEFCRFERRSDLVFNNLDARSVADDIGTVFQRIYTADIQTDAGIKLECFAAGGCLRVAEHDADLLTQLVDEDDDGVGLVDCARELAQRLAHKPRLQADV